MSQILDPIQHLKEGYLKFREHYFSDKTPLYERLVEDGQSPKVMVIACCDSRVDPSIITTANPGELFIVRNVANLVPPFDPEPHAHQHSTSSALEFAVCSLNVEHIILFGHSHCGGIKALMQRTKNSKPTAFIDAWMDIAEPAKHLVEALYFNQEPEEQCRRCEEQAMLISLVNLMSFPWIAERVTAQKLQLHAWHFDLESGSIRSYNGDFEHFSDLKIP